MSAASQYVLTGEFLDALIENDILDLADEVLADPVLSNADKLELLYEIGASHGIVARRRDDFERVVGTFVISAA